MANPFQPSHRAQVLVEYRVRIEEPRSRNGKRTLPLDDDLHQGRAALAKIHKIAQNKIA